MIIKWQSLEFLPEEQLLGILYDAGALTKSQLIKITGWPWRTLRYFMLKAKRLIQSTMNAEDEGVICYRLPSPIDSNQYAYSLTSSGVRYVLDMIHENKRVKETPRSQVVHQVQINQILMRLLQELDSNQIVWLSTVEASEELMLRLEQLTNLEFKRKELIRPDAALTIQNKRSVWIEFDNDTESTRKITKKYRAYIQFTQETKQSIPIVWVCPNEKRKERLKQIWDALIDLKFFNENNLPEMKFFTIGEETNYLIS